MTYEEALENLDENFDQYGYGKKLAYSHTCNVHIFKSKNGLKECTRDWPSPFYVKEKHLKAKDWIIVKNTSNEPFEEDEENFWEDCR